MRSLTKCLVTFLLLFINVNSSFAGPVFDSIAKDFDQLVYKGDSKKVIPLLEVDTQYASHVGLQSSNGKSKLSLIESLLISHDDIDYSKEVAFDQQYLQKLHDTWKTFEKDFSKPLSFELLQATHLQAAVGITPLDTDAEDQITSFDDYWTQVIKDKRVQLKVSTVFFDHYNDSLAWAKQYRDFVDMKKLNPADLFPGEDVAELDQLVKSQKRNLPAALLLSSVEGYDPRNDGLSISMNGSHVSASILAGDKESLIANIKSLVQDIFDGYEKQMKQLETPSEKMSLLLDTLIKIHYLHVLPDGNGRTFMLLLRKEQARWKLPFQSLPDYSLMNIALGQEPRMKLIERRSKSFFQSVKACLE